MKIIPLSHFIEWKRITDEELDAVMSKLNLLGIKNIVLHPEWAKRDSGNGNYLKMIHNKMRSFGISSTACHGLWGNDYDLNCPDENRRRQIMSAHCFFMKNAADMGSLTYTVHLGHRYPAYSEEKLRTQVRRSIDEILPEAERSGIKIALENMIDYDLSPEIAALAAEYDHSFLGLCLDTGHAHVKEGVKTAVENMAPYLFTCHLHDNNGRADQHLPPGHGTIDWDFLVTALKSCPNIINAETEAGPDEKISMEKTWELFKKTWDIVNL